MKRKCITIPAGSVLKKTLNGEYKYSDELEWHLNAYGLLISDSLKIFEYIDPVNENLHVHSHRNYEILLRSCTELEAVFRFVIGSLGINTDHANIKDYASIDPDLSLSVRRVKFIGMKLPVIIPFASFADSNPDQRSPCWYQGYNSVKHNRLRNFSEASLANCLHSLSALSVLLRILMRSDTVGPFQKFSSPLVKDDYISLSMR